MNEILFKARTVGTGITVYGTPIESVNDRVYMIHGATEDAVNTTNEVDFIYTEVVPETLATVAILKTLKECKPESEDMNMTTKNNYKCCNCGSIADPDECYSVFSGSMWWNLCHHCCSQKTACADSVSEFIQSAMANLYNVQHELRKEIKAVMVSEIYTRHNPNEPGELMYYMQIAYKNEREIITDFISGSSKQEVEEKLQQIRKTHYGQA